MKLEGLKKSGKNRRFARRDESTSTTMYNYLKPRMKEECSAEYLVASWKADSTSLYWLDEEQRSAAQLF